MITSQSRLLDAIALAEVDWHDERKETINGKSLLLPERPLQKPAHNREVAPLIIGREDDGVLVLRSAHFEY